MQQDYGREENVGYRDDAYLGDLQPRKLRQELISRSRSGERIVRELDNRVNWCWFRGEPYWIRLPTTRDVVGMDPVRRRNFLYVNLVRDAVRTLTGVMWYAPGVDAFPRTSDPGDIIRAEADRHIATHLIQERKVGQVFRRVIENCHLYGNGFMKVFWNPAIGGKRIVANAQMCPTCQGQGLIYTQMGLASCPMCASQGEVALTGQSTPGQVVNFSEEPEGEVDFVSVHPDDMVLDGDATRWDECEEIGHRYLVSPAAAWRRFGRGLNIPQKVFDDAPKGYTDFVNYSAQFTQQLLRPVDTQAIEIFEYYKKPDENHPEGIFAVFAGSRELYAGPLPPSALGQFPFFFFGMYESDGLLYPRGTVDLILPMVLAFNEHMSGLHQRAKLSAKLMFKVPDSTGIRLDNDTGHLHYKPDPRGYKPEELALAPYPQDAVQVREILVEMIDRVSGGSEALRGQVQNPDNATAMAWMEERSVGPLRPIMDEHAAVLDNVVKFAVELAKVYYQDGRLIRSFGQNGSMRVQEFRTENYNEGADVRLAAVKDLGRSRVSKMNELNEALRNQGITADVYMKLSEFGDMDQLHKAAQPHRDLAEQENRMLQSMGQMPAPLAYQDHPLHNECHAAELNSMVLRDANDPMIPMMIQHMDIHDQLNAMNQVKLQLQMQQAAAGFGMANAADPNAQPAGTPEAAGAAGLTQGGAGADASLPSSQPASPEPFPNQMSGLQGQPSYSQASQNAGAMRPPIPGG